MSITDRLAGWLSKAVVEVPVRCGDCGATVEAGADHCPECGSTTGGFEEPVPVYWEL